MMVTLFALPTQAQFATTGTGKYKEQIFWLTWKEGTNGIGLTDWPNKSRGSKISVGTDLKSGEYTWYLNPKMRVVVKLTKSKGKLLPNNSDNYWANGLQYMYGGVNPIMLATEDGGDVTFSISIILQTKNGNTWSTVVDDKQGVVIADAESFAYEANKRSDGTPIEHIQATIPKTSKWYLMDIPTQGASGKSLSNNNYVINITNKNTTYQTLMMYVNGSAASNVGHASVFYAKGLTELKSVRQTGAGITGMAIGFFIPTQTSIAPTSYGSPMHIQNEMNFDNLVPVSGNNTIGSILSKNNGKLSELKSGSLIAFKPGSTISPLNYEIDGRNLSLDVDISAYNLEDKDGYLYAWVDINGDGIFSEDESTVINVAKGINDKKITISFPNKILTNANLGESWIRLRITTDLLINNSSNKTDVDSRSYDYASNGEVLDIPIEFLNTMDKNSILPVTLISFNAKSLGKYNEITWQTANEENNDYFEILKSTNGTNGWVTVQKVSPNKNQQYKVVDNNISSSTNYYRLKQVDKDGNETLFAIHKVVNDITSQKLTFKTYPMPFLNQFIFETMIPENGKYSIEIYAMSGNKVYHQEMNYFVGVQKINITNLNNLQNGSYILKFHKNHQTIASSIIIKQ